MKMTCQNARSLVPSYLDRELTEDQAAPLRAHLMDCPRCRESVKAGHAHKRWFEPARDEPVVVPTGFAARVARRAFAGDPGAVTPPGPVALGRETVLPFVLVLSALAAGLLFAFSILIQRHRLPVGSGLEAQQLERAPWELEEEPASADDEGGPDEDLSEGEDE